MVHADKADTNAIRRAVEAHGAPSEHAADVEPPLQEPLLALPPRLPLGGHGSLAAHAHLEIRCQYPSPTDQTYRKAESRSPKLPGNPGDPKLLTKTTWSTASENGSAERAKARRSGGSGVNSSGEILRSRWRFQRSTKYRKTFRTGALAEGEGLGSNVLRCALNDDGQHVRKQIQPLATASWSEPIRLRRCKWRDDPYQLNELDSVPVGLTRRWIPESLGIRLTMIAGDGGQPSCPKCSR